MRKPSSAVISLCLALVAVGLAPASHTSAGLTTCRVPQTRATIQAAVDDDGCGRIVLDDSTFVEVVTIDRDVEIVGQGMNDSIVDAALSGRAFAISNSADHVIFRKMTIKNGKTGTGGSAIETLGTKLTLDRVKIADNVASHTGVPAITTGAAVYAGGQLIMKRSRVIDNTHQDDALGYGGGVYLTLSQERSIITDSVFTGNAAYFGGGLYTQRPVTIRRTVFKDNEINKEEGEGAGLHVVNGGKALVTDSSFEDNQALANDADGGAIGINGNTARLTLLRSTLLKNFADYGGGINVIGGKATVRDSLIRENAAFPGFGGGVNNEAKAVIRNTTFFKNETGDGGGAIENFGSAASLTLVNSTLTRNTATNYGGGIDAYNGSSAMITNVTFMGNEAVNAFGGGFHFDGTDEDYDVRNVVSVGNLGSNPDCDGTFDSQGGNVIGSTNGCGNLNHPTDLIADANLGPLKSNGGPTNTHALQPGSPAIGRGRPGCPGSDQRGAPREDCDSGSYELVRCEGELVDLVGTGGKDRLVGKAKANGILGLGGEDKLIGKGGTDGLCGGKGDDRLSGGGAADGLDGQDGTDVCIGGPGPDSAKACETEKSI